MAFDWYDKLPWRLHEPLRRQLEKQCVTLEQQMDSIMESAIDDDGPQVTPEPYQQLAPMWR